MFAVVAAGILADTWVPGIPLGAVPDVWNPARARDFATVLELPLGGTGEDVAAMYRTIWHHRPTINGYSGYAPPHYAKLMAALANRDDTTFDELASDGPLLVVADKDKGGDWAAFVRGYRGATPVGEEGRWTFFSLPRRAFAPAPCDSEPLPIAAASDNRGAVALATITDANRFTWWTSGHPQQIGDTLLLDLGRAARPCAVVLWQDGFQPFYPYALSAATSLDGAGWTTVFSGKTGALAIRGALASPVRPQLAIPLPASPARFISLRVEQAREKDPWVVTDIAVKGTR